mgnify:FL=1
MSRNERRRRRKRRVAARKAALIALILAGVAFTSTTLNGGKDGATKEELRPVEARWETAELVKASLEHPIRELENVCIRIEESLSQEQEEDPMKPEDIVAELVAQGYYRDDVPLDYELQDYLHLACQEFDVDYYIMLALIEKETAFQNIAGDGGRSQGYCQIQKRWWAGLMDEIGATDLTNPEDNFRTACAIIASHIEQFGSVEYALTAYNSGSPGTSQYAAKVLELAEKWRKVS